MFNYRKEKALEDIQEMPDNFDLEALIERLIFIEKVEKGLEQAKKGKVISHQELENIAKQW
jgi:predicted transcriptional regulator